MFRPSRLGLGAALAAAFAFAPSARAAEPDKLLPAAAEGVISVNVRQLIESDIMKKYALEQMKQSLQGNDAQRLLRELGLDPFKDIDRIIITLSGKDRTDMKLLVIVRGKFDPDKLYKTAEAQTKKDPDRFSLVRDGDDKMFKFQPDNGNPLYGTVVDETSVVLGNDKKVIGAALAAATSTKKPTVNKDLAALIGKMDDKASIWVAAVVKDKLDKLKLPGGGGAQNFQAQIPNLDTVTMVVKVTGDVNLEVGLGMKDANSADEMAKTVDDMLQTVKGALPFLAANEPKLKPLVDASKSLKSNLKDRTVVITAKLAGDALGKILNPGD